MHKSRRRRSRSSENESENDRSAAAETEAQVTRSSSKTLMESSQQPLYSFDGAWVRVSGFDEGFQPPLEPSLPEAALTTKEGLENLLKRNNPIAYFVGLSVNHLDEAALTLEAPVLPANSNTHRTGFAGSIYIVAALAVWGKMLSEMYRANMCATHFHVIRRATISYLRPVDRLGNIVATCALPPTTTTTTHQDDGRRFLATDNLKSIFDEARSGAPKLRFFVTATVQGSAPHKPAAEVEAEVVLLPRQQV